MIYISMAEMRRRLDHSGTFNEVEVRPHGRPVPSNAIHDWALANGQGEYAAICLSDYNIEGTGGRYWVFYFTDPNEAFEFKLLWG